MNVYAGTINPSLLQMDIHRLSLYTPSWCEEHPTGKVQQKRDLNKLFHLEQ